MSTLRQWLRQTVPLSIRQSWAHARRRLQDIKNGIDLKNQRASDLSGYQMQVELTQPIMPSALFENKLSNLRHSAHLLNLCQIQPQQIWSFWHTIGSPTENNGFVVGRNLVNGELTRQVSGGLCQSSSLIYHLALLAGMTILERHPHSIDIYEEEQRFTPLGADATVVWGFKDLRLINPHPFDVIFECFVHEHLITARVYAAHQLPQLHVQFVRQSLSDTQARVTTMVNQVKHTETIYEQKQGIALKPQV